MYIIKLTCFVVEIQNVDNKRKQSGLFCATLYMSFRYVQKSMTLNERKRYITHVIKCNYKVIY